MPIPIPLKLKWDSFSLVANQQWFRTQNTGLLHDLGRSLDIHARLANFVTARDKDLGVSVNLIHYPSGFVGLVIWIITDIWHFVCISASEGFDQDNGNIQIASALIAFYCFHVIDDNVRELSAACNFYEARFLSENKAFLACRGLLLNKRRAFIYHLDKRKKELANMILELSGRVPINIPLNH